MSTQSIFLVPSFPSMKSGSDSIFHWFISYIFFFFFDNGGIYSCDSNQAWSNVVKNINNFFHEWNTVFIAYSTIDFLLFFFFDTACIFVLSVTKSKAGQVISNNFKLVLSIWWNFLKFINKFLHFVGHTHTRTNKKYRFRTRIHLAFNIGTCPFWSKNVDLSISEPGLMVFINLVSYFKVTNSLLQ